MLRVSEADCADADKPPREPTAYNLFVRWADVCLSVHSCLHLTHIHSVARCKVIQPYSRHLSYFEARGVLA